jgi:hypothetical protein
MGSPVLFFRFWSSFINTYITRAVKMTSYFPISKYIIVWYDLYSNLNLHVYSVWNYADITYYNVFSAKGEPICYKEGSIKMEFFVIHVIFI